MLRKLFGIKSLVAISVVMFFVPLVSTSQGQDDVTQVCCDKDRSIVKLREKVASDLDVLASDLSVLLAQDATKNFIAREITKAKKRTVGLGQVLGALRVKDPNNSDKRIEATTRIVLKIESVMTEFGIETARVDIKLPVKAHAKLLRGADEVFVAIAPLADEKDVDKVIAFSNGKRLELDTAKPPEVPTLVVIGAEPQSSDPGYPIPVVSEPGNEEKKARVDDYIGIPYIYIYDDHENWWCGDPEIYVRVKRFRFSDFKLINQKINLPGVNDEQVWYYLGDWNSTYKYVSTSGYAPVIRFEFWEEDSGFHGGDDHLGSINIWWTSLPFGGYTEYATGDVKFDVDRD
ncbi:MAG: hypothetical protein ACYS6K_20670 [Planctomycetota bacterium]|jgi:hypothetical protein